MFGIGCRRWNVVAALRGGICRGETAVASVRVAVRSEQVRGVDDGEALGAAEREENVGRPWVLRRLWRDRECAVMRGVLEWQRFCGRPTKGWQCGGIGRSHGPQWYFGGVGRLCGFAATGCQRI